VIPRPPTWRPGEPAPWAHLTEAERSGIGVSRVIGALEALGQSGPVPAGIGSERVLGPSVLINESHAPEVRSVNAAVLAVLFEEEVRRHP
jgi:hypothetical protein